MYLDLLSWMLIPFGIYCIAYVAMKAFDLGAECSRIEDDEE